jgi:hypothetical protein
MFDRYSSSNLVRAIENSWNRSMEEYYFIWVFNVLQHSTCRPALLGIAVSSIKFAEQKYRDIHQQYDDIGTTSTTPSSSFAQEHHLGELIKCIEWEDATTMHDLEKKKTMRRRLGCTSLIFLAFWFTPPLLLVVVLFPPKRNRYH